MGKFTMILCFTGALPIFSPAQDQTVIIEMEPQKRISSYIYGANEWCNGNGIPHTASRWGGNRQTGYNWETNASNAGSDWNHSSDDYLVQDLSQAQQSIPGMAVMELHERFRPRSQYILATLQMAGYVSADMDGTVSEGETAPSTRWEGVAFQKPGGDLSTQPDLNDGMVYIDEFINYVVGEKGSSTQGGIDAWSLDNEPALWRWTHPRIHPEVLDVEELLSKSAEAAAAVKRVDPGAEVFGPASWGWGGMAYLDDQGNWSSSYAQQDEWFLDTYLKGMQQAGNDYGARLLDVLDVHWYPEAQGDCRIMLSTECDQTSPNQSQARLQAPRSLWDDSYVETSWVSDFLDNEPINLLGRIQASIDQFYPGTKIAITEYEYGAHDHYSGGIAQADVLGIFGREGVYLATLWSDPGDFTSSAFNIFLNTDGNGLAFGDLSIPVTVEDVSEISVYAALSSGQAGRMHFIAINKTGSSQTTQFQLHSSGAFLSAEVYGFGETIGSSVTSQQGVANISNNAFEYNLPSHSVLHFVVLGENIATVAKTSRKSSQKGWRVLGSDLVFSSPWYDPKENRAAKVRILSPDGVTHYQGSLSSNALDVSHYPPGRYLLLLQGGPDERQGAWVTFGIQH